MTALLRVLARSGVVFSNPFRAQTRYVRPRHGDARRDFQRIAGDMSAISKDFRKVAAKELAIGESTHER